MDYENNKPWWFDELKDLKKIGDSKEFVINTGWKTNRFLLIRVPNGFIYKSNHTDQSPVFIPEPLSELKEIETLKQEIKEQKSLISQLTLENQKLKSNEAFLSIELADKIAENLETKKPKNP